MCRKGRTFYLVSKKSESGPGQLSRYSDSLRAGRSGDRIPVGGEISRTRPHLPWGPPSLLYSGYRVSLSGLKRPGRGVDHPPPSSAEFKERVELYLYSPLSVFVAYYRVNLKYKIKSLTWMQQFWSSQNTLIEVPKVLVAAFLVRTCHNFVGATNVQEKHMASIFMCHQAEDNETNFHCLADPKSYAGKFCSEVV